MLMVFTPCSELLLLYSPLSLYCKEHSLSSKKALPHGWWKAYATRNENQADIYATSIFLFFLISIVATSSSEKHKLKTEYPKKQRNNKKNKNRAARKIVFNILETWSLFE